MNNTDKTMLALIGVAVVAVVLFNLRAGSAAAMDDGNLLSQSPTNANTDGPAYLVAKMPYGYGPPVMMQAPMASQGFAGQVTPVFGDCGCD